MKFIFLMIVSSLVFAEGKSQAIEVDAVLDRCCELGRHHSASSQKCSSINFNIPDSIKPQHQALCRSNVEFCCHKNRQEKNCKDGIQLARQRNANCNDRSQSEMFQICCNACKVGQQIAQVGGKCLQPAWGSMSDHARHDCCYFNYDFKEDADENISPEDEDLEEAADYMMSCGDHDCSHKCELRNGSATCVCGDGFHLAVDGRTCVSGIADPIRRDDCEKGFKKDFSGDCEDIDECQEGTHSCKESETCVNTEGSFTCEFEEDCDDGSQYNRRTRMCEDINECQSSNPCLPSEICINTEGSYDCRAKSCSYGFRLNKMTGNCDDIDECESGHYRCGRNAHCVNTAGSFLCVCDQGFRHDFYDQSFCVDVDECATPGTCQQNCQNSQGSYRCFCSHGFRLNGDNRTCTDIDECATGKHYCEKICKNTVGSYRCECPEGFKLINNQFCDDINECELELLKCNKNNEKCLNTYGSAKCMKKTCEPGYRMNKRRGNCVLMDRSLCFDNSNEIDESCQVPEKYDFIFGSLRANAVVPKEGLGLFVLTVNSTKKFDFEIKSLQTLSIARDVKRADLSYFRTELSEKSFHNISLKMMKSIEGPQEVQLDVWIKFKGKAHSEDGIVAAKIFMVVS